ncbi:MarR family winged helix-turn-helix transcriptional regulator [Sphaerisporangium perillae]|uniref:MarR family winged helix-turn-helix transcriptional regulator n=1 Tax=Sphaerisporangium perillae TaxID=2935860 RepID=UPI00200FA5FF|nr:MarR family winged helix-turn-helix transcriptional regulator [Sphaerisporangium perillae]
MTSTRGKASGSGKDGTPAGGNQDAEAAALLDAVGPAFSRLRRTVLLDVENPVSRKDMTRTLVLNIVEEGAENRGQEITVGVVGERLAVDPSVASRMVSDCISAGYLVRAASQLDGRRTILRLSPEGAGMLANFRRHQRQAFEYITRDWAERDRLDFARLLLKYVDSIADLGKHS